MALFSWLIQKKTPEQKLLEKFYDMHLTWERETSDLIRYRATFPIKGLSAADISQGTILIWEYSDYYVVCITYDAAEKTLMLRSKTCEAENLIGQARTQVDKRDQEAARKAQDKLQTQCRDILKLLP